MFAFLMTVAFATPQLAPEITASWYGHKFAGRLTANGETFRPEEMTAAHKSLPFNTLIHLTNVTNGKTVVVRINDRGPFVAGRSLDLSEHAAIALGYHSTGTATLKTRIIRPEEAHLIEKQQRSRVALVSPPDIRAPQPR